MMQPFHSQNYIGNMQNFLKTDTVEFISWSVHNAALLQIWNRREEYLPVSLSPVSWPSWFNCAWTCMVNLEIEEILKMQRQCNTLLGSAWQILWKEQMEWNGLHKNVYKFPKFVIHVSSLPANVWIYHFWNCKCWMFVMKFIWSIPTFSSYYLKDFGALHPYWVYFWFVHIFCFVWCARISSLCSLFFQ